MFALSFLALLIQTAPAAEPLPHDVEMLNEEVTEFLREVRNTPFEVARNGSGTVWQIRMGDLYTWTPEHSRIWITIHTSHHANDDASKVKELWRFDCKANTYAIEVSQKLDRESNFAGGFNADGKSAPALQTFSRDSPVDKVRAAFCPQAKPPAPK